MTTRRVGPRAFAGVASVVIAPALVVAFAATFFRDSPPPTLDGVDARVRSGQFDDAERQIDAFLKAHPHHDRANLLMAQVALGRADQKPLPALEHLARVQSSAPAVRALVLLNQGKAYSSLRRHEQAESSWIDALRADRLVAEAGWALLGIYYVENRRADARKLGPALFALEPDPRDRVQILLELLRQDVKPLFAFSVVNVFEPIVRRHPEEKHPTIALALALIPRQPARTGFSNPGSSRRKHTR